MSNGLNKYLDKKLNEARLGIEAEQFLDGPIGIYLERRANEEVADAFEELKVVSCRDHEAVLDLQNRIWRAESFKAWIGDLIMQGREAEAEIKAYDQGM